jgi:hypothetical protein
MATVSSAAPTGTRPYNALLISFLAILASLGAWFMRITTFLNDAPAGFLDVVAAGAHPNGILIKEGYTGLKHVDKGLSFLVSAFLPGAAGWNEAFYWQQFHFLLQLTAIFAIMNVEACRERNRGSWLK